MEKKNIKQKLIKLGFIVSILLLVMPSVIFFIRNGNTVYVDKDLEYKFLLNSNIKNEFHVGAYIIAVILMIFFYTLIIKKSRELFKSIKDIYKFIIIVSLICVMGLPFMSSDVYYYLGVGRLASKYKQNPYYIDIESYVEENNINLESDSALKTGYNNYWANTTVVYGALWTMICTVVGFFSFGSLNAGILIFKILNVLIHILNCMLLYKISKKKIFPLLYGINPFVLLEGIINVHNDIYMVFFMILALYMVREKKKLLCGVLLIAFATTIKYVAVLLLPLIIIYHYREEKLSVRIIKCIEYGLIFCVFMIIPYAIYIRDLNVFNGIIVQQKRYAKGLYCYLFVKYPQYIETITYIRLIIIYCFVLTYLLICTKLITCKQITWYKEIRKIYIMILFFLFFMITNAQPWYFVWLSSLIVWQKSDNIKLIMQMQILTIIANSVFVLYNESFKYGKEYFEIFIILTWVCMIFNVSKRLYRNRRIRLEKSKN